jgi:hypothetical protein
VSVLQKIAFYQNRRDEAPNQELARRLAQSRDAAAIAEIAAGLWHADANVQSDCLKVLYEIGYLAPELIAGYVADFLKLLHSRNNRMVWGGMIALSTIAHLRADEIYAQRATIEAALETGSVITVDNAVGVLAAIAAHSERYRRELFPVLLKHLQTTRLKDIPQHAEKVLQAVDTENKQEFISVLEQRLPAMSATQSARVKRVIKAAQKR